jgi:hypothetical protein
MLGIPDLMPHKRCPTMLREEVREAAANGWEIVAIVRNPYDRFLSCWKDKSQKMSKDKGGCGASKSCPVNISFESFARTVAGTPDCDLDGHAASQKSMIVHRGKPLYTRIIKVEDIDTEWSDMRKKYTGLPELPFRHVTPNMAFDPYTPAIRNIVKRRYKGDFEQFGYAP